MKAIIIIVLISALTYACLIKFSDRLEQKQPKREIVTVSNLQIRVDKIMSEYYGRPNNFEALNKMTPEQLDTIIKEAGY
jgi:hypothetical protein